MRLKFNIFSNPQKLDLSSKERTMWLQPLMSLLRDNPTEVGRVLFGLKAGPWRKQDVRETESLIASKAEDKRTMAGYLSILHEAAIRWSACTRRRVSLPHFLPPERKFDNPFSKDYSTAVSVHKKWKSKLSEWVVRLQDVRSEAEPRDLRLAAVLVSAIVHGGVFGVPFLVALVRAIPEWERRTFVVGRVHIELTLARKGVADAEHRIWLPDSLTATLWSSLVPADADDLLAPAMRGGKSLPPGDAAVLRRIGKLINKFRAGKEQELLPGIEELRQCAREVCMSECAPVFVAYNNTEFCSESLRRSDVVRLFPGSPLLEFGRPADPELRPPAVVNTEGQSTMPPEPAWMDLLLSAAQSKSVRARLPSLAKDAPLTAALRLVADFGIALDSRSSRPGKRIPASKIAATVIFIARSLGCMLGDKDLAALGPAERRAVYLDAINQQPVRDRRDAVQAIREFDLYLVAQNTDAVPVPRNSLPWVTNAGSVDPNLITHREYFEIINRIEAEWPVLRGERERRLVRLLVRIAFRAGLRRGELRGLRMEDVLILGFVWLHVRHRKGEPLKTRNAERQLPIGALLCTDEPNDELQELRDWFRMRTAEGAKATDYLFTLGKGKRIPCSLFDDLNAFLRKVTPYANEGKGVHMHTLRHAAGAWLFASLTLSHSKRRDSLFPDLHETHVWLREGKSLWRHLCGNTKESKKAAFITASFCGHASFDTTASSYINIFPWLVAHALDGVESFRPDPELVRRASGVPLKRSKKWLRDGEVHDIPVHLLVNEGALARTGVQSQSDARQVAADWLLTAWQRLVSRDMSEAGSCASAEDQAMFERADWLMKLENSQGDTRHPLEHQPKSGVALSAPLKPKHAKNADNSTLRDLIVQPDADQRSLMIDAVGVFAVHHERDGFVRFDSISELQAADLYIGFLRSLGFQKRELELVSGDPDQDSQHRREWQDRLSETYLRIRSSPPGPNYRPKTSLWVRPSELALAKRNTGPAGFRFTMAMAFIVYGVIPLKTPK
jgi:integrase